LHTKPGQPVSLYCGAEKKLEGQLGKMDDHKAIKVTKNISDVNNEQAEKK
jgi:flagellar motor switch protein FliM